jgi:S-adenosylmethionine hydrolase
VSVENRELFLDRVSTTFHGRDIFAPVAAHLANGLDPRALGPAIRAIEELVACPVPEPRESSPGVLEGQIVHVDRFGNLITNVPEAHGPDVLHLMVAGHRIQGPAVRAYGERAPGELLVIGGSSGLLEVSKSGGDAARALATRRGDRVSVSLSRGHEP